MSGHSKWANIKNRKGAADKKRSMVFTKVSKDILTAIRESGGNTNIDSNLKLKQAVEKARLVNMPKENIERLIKRFEDRKANLVSITFEGYGPAGVPMIIEVESDNKNRIVAEIRLIMKNYGGSLGESNSVLFQFERRGYIEVERELSEDETLELIDAGLEDVDGKVLWTDSASLQKVVGELEKKGIGYEEKKLAYRASNPMKIEDEESLEKMFDLIEALEENEDVVNVYVSLDE